MKKNDMSTDSYWILGMGGIGISLGLLVYGYKIKPPAKKINYIILLIILYLISAITYGTASYALAVFGLIGFFQLIFFIASSTYYLHLQHSFF